MSSTNIELIEFTHQKMVRWYCPSNSFIHYQIAFLENSVDMRVNFSQIPRIGEMVCINDNGYKARVKDVIYTLRSKYGYSEVNVILEPEIIEVSYYDYMKTYTHCEDALKYGSSNCDGKKYKAVFPETFDEWKKDILELNDKKNKSVEWLEEAENRRCKLIE